MSFEYKCVGAPERPKKQRGVRGRSDRVALAMQAIIQEEAVDGWEYQRTDLVPVEEKSGLFSRAHEVHRAVLVFRRELDPEPRYVRPARLSAGDGAGQNAPHAAATAGPAANRDTGASAPGGPAAGESADGPGRGRLTLSAARDQPSAPPPQRSHAAPQSGTSQPGAAQPGATRDEPTPPTRPNRPPSGLG